jgi:hypothetical protein
MGARFMGAVFVLSTAWYAWPWRSPGLSVLSIAMHVIVLSFVAAIIGKVIGIALYRRRKRLDLDNRAAGHGLGRLRDHG